MPNVNQLSGSFTWGKSLRLKSEEKQQIISLFEKSYGYTGSVWIKDEKLLDQYIKDRELYLLKDKSGIVVGGIFLRKISIGKRIATILSNGEKIVGEQVMDKVAEFIIKPGHFLLASGKVKHILEKYYFIDNISNKEKIIKAVKAIYPKKRIDFISLKGVIKFDSDTTVYKLYGKF